MTVEPKGRLITSPLGVKTKTSSGIKSLLMEWTRSVTSSLSAWFSSIWRIQARRSPRAALSASPGRHAQLIFPMGRDAVLCRVVHLPGADLHLKGHTGLCDDGGVQRLVHVGLGHGDVVLKPARQRLEHIVDNAQHVVAVLNGIHDDPHGKYIVDFPQRSFPWINILR